MFTRLATFPAAPATSGGASSASKVEMCSGTVAKRAAQRRVSASVDGSGVPSRSAMARTRSRSRIAPTWARVSSTAAVVAPSALPCLPKPLLSKPSMERRV